jgi:hypothetical protein
LVEALGLRFGGIDLVLDEAGTYWFFEITPQRRVGMAAAVRAADRLCAR